MQAKHARCPKCQGQLYLEQDVGSQFRLPPEWTCLQCGWRRTYTPRELERTFAVTDEGTTPDDFATVVSAAVSAGYGGWGARPMSTTPAPSEKRRSWGSILATLPQPDAVSPSSGGRPR